MVTVLQPVFTGQQIITYAANAEGQTINSANSYVTAAAVAESGTVTVLVNLAQTNQPNAPFQVYSFVDPQAPARRLRRPVHHRQQRQRRHRLHPHRHRPRLAPSRHRHQRGAFVRPGSHLVLQRQQHPHPLHLLTTDTSDVIITGP
jgi:hypothetical protein